jgi:hypothetical protein
MSVHRVPGPGPAARGAATAADSGLSLAARPEAGLAESLAGRAGGRAAGGRPAAGGPQPEPGPAAASDRAPMSLTVTGGEPASLSATVTDSDTPGCHGRPAAGPAAVLTR